MLCVNSKSLHVIYKGAKIKLKLANTSFNDVKRLFVFCSFYIIPCRRDIAHVFVFAQSPGTLIILLFYDITKYQSFNNLDLYLCHSISQKDDKVIVIGCKKDLTHRRVISPEKGKEFCLLNRILYGGECSAKTSEGVKEVWNIILETLMDKYPICNRCQCVILPTP